MQPVISHAYSGAGTLLKTIRVVRAESTTPKPENSIRRILKMSAGENSLSGFFKAIRIAENPTKVIAISVISCRLEKSDIINL